MKDALLFYKQAKYGMCLSDFSRQMWGVHSDKSQNIIKNPDLNKPQKKLNTDNELFIYSDVLKNSK